MKDFMEDNLPEDTVLAKVEGLACLAALGANVPNKGPATLE